MNIFFTPDITGLRYTLTEDESKHCIRVLRHEKGDTLTLTDGKGWWYDAEIVEANPKRCSVEVRSKRYDVDAHRPKLHMAVAPTKNNDRMEWFLEKATEIGIQEITPLICEHSERKQVNSDRFEKVMISAMKQSLKATLPTLNNLTTFDAFMKQHAAKNGFIAYCGDVDKVHLFNALSQTDDAIVLIGPEGDFSEQEVAQAISAGFKIVTLGNSRLRTETAGMVACNLVNLFWDLKSMSFSQ